MSVDVGVGDAHLLLPSGAKSYWCWTDASANVTVTAANATNPRIDTVVAWLDQTLTTTSSNNSPGAFRFRIFDGTPAGTPSPVTDAAIQSTLGASVGWEKLGFLNVAANSSNVTNANITDARRSIGSILSSPIVKSTNPYKFLVYRNAAAGTTSGSSVRVPFETKIYDTNNNFDAATNSRYTAPVAGFYSFSWQVNLFGGTSNDNISFLYKNGVALAESPGTPTGGTGVGSTIVVPAAAGDYFEVFVYVNASGVNMRVSNMGTRFSGFLVSAS